MSQRRLFCFEIFKVSLKFRDLHTEFCLQICDVLSFFIFLSFCNKLSALFSLSYPSTIHIILMVPFLKEFNKSHTISLFFISHSSLLFYLIFTRCLPFSSLIHSSICSTMFQVFSNVLFVLLTSRICCEFVVHLQNCLLYFWRFNLSGKVFNYFMNFVFEIIELPFSVFLELTEFLPETYFEFSIS